VKDKCAIYSIAIYSMSSTRLFDNNMCEGVATTTGRSSRHASSVVSDNVGVNLEFILLTFVLHL